jgi:hypothetical protein
VRDVARNSLKKIFHMAENAQAVLRLFYMIRGRPLLFAEEK